MTTAENMTMQSGPGQGPGASGAQAPAGADLSDEVRRSVEELGPADPQVVELERLLNEAVQAGQPPGEVARIKEQLLAHYYPALLERASRLNRMQFKTDVFFEVYNLRIIALSGELGRPGTLQSVIAHLLLAGIYHERDERERMQHHLTALRHMLETRSVDLTNVDADIVNRITESVHAVTRPSI